MMVKVNCKHADGFGYCDKKPKIRWLGFLWLTKEPCPEYGRFGYSCDIADRFPRPNAPPPSSVNAPRSTIREGFIPPTLDMPPPPPRRD